MSKSKRRKQKKTVHRAKSWVSALKSPNKLKFNNKTQTNSLHDHENERKRSNKLETKGKEGKAVNNQPSHIRNKNGLVVLYNNAITDTISVMSGVGVMVTG